MKALLELVEDEEMADPALVAVSVHIYDIFCDVSSNVCIHTTEGIPEHRSQEFE